MSNNVTGNVERRFVIAPHKKKEYKTTIDRWLDCATEFDDDINFKSTGIEAFDDNHKEEYKNFIKNQNENFLGLWLNYKTETSTVYLNYDHQFYQKDFNHIVSRGSEIIDLILNFIRSNK